MTMSNVEPKQYVHFPTLWNVKWSTDGITDLEKAKIILFDFISKDDYDDDGKATLWDILQASEEGGHFETVSSLATAVQQQVFRNQHSSFDTNSLLQRMRFILIKCQPNMPKLAVTDSLRNFFFDVSLTHGLATDSTKPSDDITVLESPRSALKVVIIGGGPTGLLGAITLAEQVRCRELVQIHVYDKRWTNEKFGEFLFTVYPEDQRRRDQVITLQDHVTKLLSDETNDSIKYGLGKLGAERVWPESRNLQIRKVEDALLKRAQDSAFDGMMHLHGADIIDEATLIQEAGEDFHLLLGTDGANSWVRRHYFKEDEESCGSSLALGVALDRGQSRLPRPQALNIFLTLCQTRYLLNASHRDGTGYLNMLLTEKEYNECVSLDGTPCDFRSPAYIRINGAEPPGISQDQIFAPYDAKSSLWESISDGLQLFGFDEVDVKSIVRIPINLVGVKIATKAIALESGTRLHPHCLVSLAGDSALTHHFWPGRGMNSGIKAAIAWAHQISDLVLERGGGFAGLDPVALSPFQEFMQQLRQREHNQRSFVIQATSGAPERMEAKLRQASEQRAPDWKTVPVLCDRVLRFAKRFEGRDRGRFDGVMNGLDGTIKRILSHLRTRTKAEMYHSGPWPTEEMGAPEVHPPKSRFSDKPRSRASVDTCITQSEPTHTTDLKRPRIKRAPSAGITPNQATAADENSGWDIVLLIFHILLGCYVVARYLV
ncbi:hypothetical protein N8I77_010776 [Diaporthe amygdali]|uniref:Uncharacterized protein n=1 Tax=Phomopsis amygdali TaxID=1214568 RepID=A0AAD9W266_PHOAM|nr:hypothetical protein N8I77_010776 [Diaporthe amygdali]